MLIMISFLFSVPGVTEYAARHSISGNSIPNVLETVRNFDAEDHKLLTCKHSVILTEVIFFFLIFERAFI